MCDSAPVERASAAGMVHPVDEEGEGGEPGTGQEQVEGPVVEAARKREKPQDGKEQGQAGDDFNVDEARERPAVARVVVVEVGSDDARDDLFACQMDPIRRREGYSHRQRPAPRPGGPETRFLR